MLLRVPSDASGPLTPKNLEEKCILQNLEKMGLATKFGDANEFQPSDKWFEVADELRADEAA